jgi:WD40 repeat protein
MKPIVTLVVTSVGCVAFLALAFAAQCQPPVQRPVRGVALSTDGKLVAAVAGNAKEVGSLTLWDLGTTKPCWTFTEKQGLRAVAFAPDGKLLAAGGQDKIVRIFDAATGKVTTSINHPEPILDVAFSPEGTLLATTCGDNAMRVWDIATGTEKLTCRGQLGRMERVQFSPDGKLLLTSGGQDGAKIWDAGSGAVKRTWTVPKASLHCAVFANSNWIMAGDSQITLHLWNIETGAERARLSGFGSGPELAFATDGDRFVFSGHSPTDVHVFDMALREPNVEELARIKTLLVQLDDDSYEARENASRQLVKFGLVAEPTLRRALKESHSAEVRIRCREALYEILNTPRAKLRGHVDIVGCVAITRDGKTVATGSKDGTVRLWEAETGKELVQLTVAQ